MVIKQFAGKWKFRWFYFWLLYSLFYSSTEIISKYSIHHAHSNLITTQEHHRLLVTTLKEGYSISIQFFIYSRPVH